MQAAISVDPKLIASMGDKLLDPWWRLTSGALYRIMTKDDPSQPGAVMQFLPFPEQLEFFEGMWYRNIILKDRQRGFTTAAVIYLLDHALFVPDQRCGLIAHTEPDARAIFRDKAKFAYDNLPADLRERMPLARDAAEELLFAHNNSSIRVSTSMRSATIHRLHVSEMGKIAAKHPEKAREIASGALPAVPQHGVATIESTAEGASGVFHRWATDAQKLWEAQAPLGVRDFKFFFSAWWTSQEHRVDPMTVRVSPTEHEYFDKIEGSALFIQRMGAGAKIDAEQRAWYIATRDGECFGDQALMWREYPSSPEECWQQSTEGAYYATELARARVAGRIRAHLPVATGAPCNTFWDIGKRDGCAIWVHQHVHPEHRFIGFVEGWEEPFSHFAKALDDMADRRGLVWGTHYLPHDASHERQGETELWSPLMVLRKLKPSWNFAIVPRVNELKDGINAVRMVFPEVWIDETECKEGVVHLASYRKRHNAATGYWMDEPFKDEHTEAADAFRQFAQAKHMLKFAGQGLRRPKRKGREHLA